MGKAKKTRSRGHKAQVPPTGGLSEIEKLNLENVAPSHSEVVSGLSSLDSQTRDGTCVVLANLFGNPSLSELKKSKMLKSFILDGAIKKLIPRTVDGIPSIRLHAIGALRNMVVVGGLEFCDYLVAQGIVTPLLKVLNEYAVTIQENTPPIFLLILEQLFFLLGHLCENSDSTVQSITETRVVEKLITYFSHNMNYPLELKLAAAQFCLTISDENELLRDQLVSSGAGGGGGGGGGVSQLEGILYDTQVNLLLKVYLIGFVANLGISLFSSSTILQVVSILEQALEFDPNQFNEMLGQTKNALLVLDQQSTENMEEESEQKQILEQAQQKEKHWQQGVKLLQLSIEILSNLLTSSDTYAEPEEEEWETDDEDKMEQVAALQLNSNPVCATPTKIGSDQFYSQSLFEKVSFILHGIKALPLECPSKIVLDIFCLRARACSYLSNYVQFASQDCSLLLKLFKEWLDIASQWMHEATDPMTSSLSMDPVNDPLAAITAALWSLVRCSQDNKWTFVPSIDQISLILQMSTCQVLSVDSRVNCIGMIGTIGQRQHNLTENEVLLECITKNLEDPSLYLVAEALNAVFDIYQDDIYDQVLQKHQILPKLECLASELKTKIQTERKTLERELVAHLKETRLNLVRFIKYKKNTFI